MDIKKNVCNPSSLVRELIKTIKRLTSKDLKQQVLGPINSTILYCKCTFTRTCMSEVNHLYYKFALKLLEMVKMLT